MKEMKRILALFLCLVMLVSALPVSALAAPGNNGKGPGDKNPGKGHNKPGIVETVPVTEETTAPSEETTPVTEATEPSTEATEPSTEATEPSTEATEPSTEATEPSTEATEPPTEATEPAVVAVTGITLDQTALEVGVGAEPVTLVATVLPEDAADKTVTWTSSEPGVAAVADGVLTFGYMGEAVITATAGEFSATCVVTVGEGEWDTYEGGTVVIAASDYQNHDTDPKTNTSTILSRIKADYASADGFIFGGDYSQNSLGNVNDTTSGKNELDGVVDTVFPGMDSQIYIQGNHDADSCTTNGTLSTSGAHDTDDYGVYVINEKDYPWGWQVGSSFQSTCQNTANALDDYLDAKAVEGYKKPIFVASHLPLHYTSRTNSQGDGKYAKYLYDVLDEAGKKGLNVIFLFGHNHSTGNYDDYLGGGAIYLAEGDNIIIAAEGNTSLASATQETLTFTYMNYGYVGYVSSNADDTTTMTVFEITDDKVVVKRYDANGLHNLKAEGVANSGSPKADDTVVDTDGATIKLTTPTAGGDNEGDNEGGNDETVVEKTDNNVTVSAPGITGLTVTKAEKPSFDANTYSAYASYDITPADYVEGTVATVSIALDPDDGFVDGAAFVIDRELNRTLDATIDGGILTFETDHFSVYDPMQLAETGDGTTSNRNYIYEKVSTIVPGEKYVVVSNNYAMGDNGTSLTGAAVTVNGNTIESETALMEWTFSAASGSVSISNGTHYLHGSNGKYTLAADSATVTVGQSSGNFRISHSYFSGYWNSTAYLYHNGTTWASNTNAQNVSLYKSVGRGAVDADGWVTLTPPTAGVEATPEKTAYKYTLDTNGVNAGTKYLIVNTSSAGEAYVLTNNNGTVGKTKVQISNGEIIIDETVNTDSTWTFSGSDSGAVSNQNGYVYPNNGSLSLQTNRSNMTISNEDDGEYLIYRTDDWGRKYYVRYNSGWTGTRVNSYSDTTYSVYLFAYDEPVTVPGTSATPARPGQYAKLVDTSTPADFTVTVSRKDDVNAALTKVMAEIDVVTSADKSSQTAQPDGNAVWTMSTDYDGETAGEYTVTVSYDDLTLGTVKVIVPEATVLGYSVSPESGAVVRGAGRTAEVGALITVNVKDDEGEDFAVPVTLDMLTKADGSAVSTATAGELSNLILTYNGEVISENFTLTINAKAGNNHPSYPNEGAVKVNKTATGIDFQASGVAQVEISASGVPMNQGVDVLLILDTSSSMNSQLAMLNNRKRIDVLKECVNALIQNLKKERDDGSVPDVDISVVDFAGYLGYSSLNYIDSQVKSQALAANYRGEVLLDWTDVHDVSDTWGNGLAAKSGTNYDHGLEMGYNQLRAKQVQDNYSRKQFVLFMSDGAPFMYNGVGSSETGEGNNYEKWLLGTYTQDEVDNLNHVNNPTFYYESEGGAQKHRIAEAIKGSSSETFDIPLYTETNGAWKGDLVGVPGLGATMYSVGYALEHDYGKNPTGLAGMTAILNTIAGVSPETGEKLYYPVTSKDDLEDCFDDFAGAILLAAENARFVDQMGEMYDMRMAGLTYPVVVDDQPVYKTINPAIEVLTYEIWTRAEYLEKKCTLEMIGTRKLNDNGVAEPKLQEVVVFSADGKQAYSSRNSTKTDPNTGNPMPDVSYDANLKQYVAVTGAKNILNSDGIIEAYTFWYNTNSTPTPVEGVSIPVEKYANGTTSGTTNLLPNETFYWKIGTLRSSEVAMRYYVYLEEARDDGTPPGSYATNEFATLFYDNYLENPCYKDTTSPVLAWKAATVSYAFYLVDESGTPVTMNGVKVGFADRETIIQPTVIYEEVLLNNDQGGNVFDKDLISSAEGILPLGYVLYDEAAKYNVYIDSSGIGNWKIEKGKDKNGNDLASTTYVTGFNGNEFSCELVMNKIGYDYTNTTVWFAVKMEPKPIPDTIVIDYGLNVNAHVLVNDMFGDYGTLKGVAMQDAENGVILQEGKLDEDENNVKENTADGKFGTAQAIVPETGATEANSMIRYKPFTEAGKMIMNEPEVFIYSVQYANPNEPYSANNGFYQSTLTVIPATTIYYEDEYIELSTYEKVGGVWGKSETSGWVSTATSAVQGEDRPDDFKYGFDYVIDANNIYGYDAAYANCSTYSMDNAAKVNVSATKRGEAVFEFYGTGFDVIGLTSNTTGTITVQIYKVDTNGNKSIVKTSIVDTYYGYTRDAEGNWITSPNAANALYQVPVIKHSGLAYGHYSVKITAGYNDIFNHTETPGSYDLYLDAIRIYDPAGAGDQLVYDKDGDGEKDQGDTTIADIYVQDGEGWPIYQELRNNVIAASDFSNAQEDGGAVNGIIFIDSDDTTYNVADYISYGPNNELYLAPGQAVVFSLNLGDCVNEKGESIVDRVHLGMKNTAGGEVQYAVVDGEKINTLDDLIAAARPNAARTNVLTTNTDMYYDITALKDTAIIIYNNGDGNGTGTGGIMSLTNIKVTFKEEPKDISDLYYSDINVVKDIVKAMQTILSEDESGNDKTDKQGSITLTYPESVPYGNECVIGITTSGKATDLTVGDEDEYEVTQEDEYTWSATVTVVSEDSNSMVIPVKAYFADEEPATASATIEIIPVVQVILPQEAASGNPFTVEVMADGVYTAENENGELIAAEGNSVTVNGVEAAVAVDEEGIIKWTAQITLTNNETVVQDQQVLIVADNGARSAEVTAVVKVTPKFAPDPFRADASKSEVKAGERVTITVTTSTAVEVVKIGDSTVTTYRTRNGNRIWTSQYTVKAASETDTSVSIPVYAYDASGNESAPVTVDVKISKSTDTTGTQAVVNAIRDIVTTIGNFLRGLFG